MDDEEKTATQTDRRTPAAWSVLVVDDDVDICAVTALALDGFTFEGAPLDISNAHSAAEARSILKERSDIALVLLDVVMETDHAGLELAREIRETMGNHLVRIVLRTGQPGQAPESKVVAEYDIDGYVHKTSATSLNLKTVVTTAIRTYSLLRQLEAREVELQMINKELERFAFAASHDLQAPMRNIENLSKLLLRQASDQLNADSRELLSMLTDNAAMLRRLIQDLLHYARMGAQSVTMGPVNMEDVLAKARAMMKADIDERGAIIDTEPLPTIEGSATQLEWLLRSLLDNALKYQPGDAPKIEVRCRSEKSGWCLTVADHGIGIPEVHRVEVFNMFKRLHGPDKYPGSGMGLAACKRVVEMHKGNIEISETPGGGTTVTVSLPLRQTG